MENRNLAPIEKYTKTSTTDFLSLYFRMIIDQCANDTQVKTENLRVLSHSFDEKWILIILGVIWLLVAMYVLLRRNTHLFWECGCPTSYVVREREAPANEGEKTPLGKTKH